VLGGCGAVAAPALVGNIAAAIPALASAAANVFLLIISIRLLSR
jgi:hypothetical protein